MSFKYRIRKTGNKRFRVEKLNKDGKIIRGYSLHPKKEFIKKEIEKKEKTTLKP